MCVEEKTWLNYWDPSSSSHYSSGIAGGKKAKPLIMGNSDLGHFLETVKTAVSELWH